MTAFLHEILENSNENEENGHVTMEKFFSLGLTVVILSLELMNMSHRGHKEAIRNLFRVDEGKRKLNWNWPVVVVNLLKVGVILFCATLFIWTTIRRELVLSGLAAVVAISNSGAKSHAHQRDRLKMHDTVEWGKGFKKKLLDRLEMHIGFKKLLKKSSRAKLNTPFVGFVENLVLFSSNILDFTDRGTGKSRQRSTLQDLRRLPL